MDQASIIGIDLAKHSFQVHGARADGSVAFRKKLSRGKVLDFLASQPPCVVAMEACCCFPVYADRSTGYFLTTAYAHGSGRESLPPDVEVEVRAGERVECSLYVPADGATT